MTSPAASSPTPIPCLLGPTASGKTAAALALAARRPVEIISVDSRPSDALALALRVDCPIFVDDLVLKTSKLAANSSERVSADEMRKYLENLNDDDLGKYKM